MGIWLAGGMKKLSGIKSWWRLHNFVNMLKPTTLNPSKGWILWYVNCHLSKKGNMFVYLRYRPEFTFIYKPGPKQEFDELEPPRDHYKGIETVTPSRDRPVAILRQVKTPLVSTLQNHRNVFHSIRTTHLYYRGRQFPTSGGSWRPCPNGRGKGSFTRSSPLYTLSWLKPFLGWYPKTTLERKTLLPQAFWPYHMSARVGGLGQNCVTWRTDASRGLRGQERTHERSKDSGQQNRQRQLL